MSRRPEISLLFKQLGENAPAGFAAGLHIRFAAPLIAVSTYDPKWSEHYTVNAYGLRDPMISWGLSCEGTTRWSEIELPDPFNIWGQAADFGLIFGAAFACGPIQSRTIVGIARDDREFTDAEIEKVYGLILRFARDLGTADRAHSRPGSGPPVHRGRGPSRSRCCQAGYF